MSTQKIPHISGHFHFYSKVTIDEIISIAEDFAQDENFVKIFIQGAGSDGENRLCFIYDPKLSEEKVPYGYVNEFADIKTDILRRKLGNGLKGWSISNNYISIK